MADITEYDFPADAQELNALNAKIFGADATTGQPGFVKASTLQQNASAQLVGTLDTESQAPPTTRQDGTPLQVMDGISYSIPDGTTWTTQFLDANGNAIVLTGPVSGVIRFMSAGVWTDQPAQVNYAGIVKDSDIGVTVADQSDVASLLANTVKTNIAFNNAGSYYDTSGNIQPRTGDQRISKDQISLNTGDKIYFGLNSADSDATTMALLAKFNPDADYTFNSVIVAAADHLNVFYEGSWTADEPCNIGVSDGYIGLGTAYVYIVRASDKIYVTPSDINNEESVNDVTSLDLHKKEAAGIDYTAPYLKAYKSFDKILKNTIINPTTGALTTDVSRDLYMCTLKSGDVVNFTTHVWGAGNYLAAAITDNTGAILSTIMNGTASAVFTSSYASAQDCILYVVNANVAGNTDKTPYSYTPSIIISTTNTGSTAVPGKVLKADFNNIINAKTSEAAGATIPYEVLFSKQIVASTSVSGAYGVNNTSSKKDVYIGLRSLKAGRTYTINWNAAASPYGIYVIIPTDTAHFVPLTLTDNGDGTYNFTMPGTDTGADYVVNSYYSVIAQISLSTQVTPYSTWVSYLVTGTGKAAKADTVINEKSLGYPSLQSASINLYTYSNWLAKDGTQDFSQILQNALFEVSQMGGGKVYIPRGMYIINNVITPSNVTLEGEDMNSVTLYTTGVNAAFINNGTIYDYRNGETKNFIARNMTVDGSRVVASAYDVSMKGFYLQYTNNCLFENIIVINTGATGFGCDFLKGTTVRNITAINCGRLATSAQTAGASGIGIGTGKYGDVTHSESSLLTGLHAYNCGQYGIFLEQQYGDFDAIGYRITDSYAEGCRVGFGTSGASGSIFSACSAYANKEAGFSADSGSFASSSTPIRISRKTIFANCTAAYNGTSAIDPTSNDYLSGNGFVVKGQQPTKGFLFNGCNAFSNMADGFVSANDSDTVSNINIMSINGGQSIDNGRHGVLLKNANQTNVNIQGLICNDNSRNGIMIDANLLRSMIANNVLTANGGYGLELMSGRTLTDYIVRNNLVKVNTTGQFQNIAEN